MTKAQAKKLFMGNPTTENFNSYMDARNAEKESKLKTEPIKLDDPHWQEKVINLIQSQI